MALAPRRLAVCLLACRAVVVALEATALVHLILSGYVGFSVLVFLETVLSAQLPFNIARLLYGAAQVFFNVPLPSERRYMSALVIADWVMLYLLFAAGTSSLAVVDYVEKNMRACPLMAPGTCARYWAAASLTMSAWAFSAPIAVMMLWVGVIWARAAAHA